MNKQQAIRHPNNNRTEDMVKFIDDCIPSGFELFYSYTHDGWSFRKSGTKHPSVQIWDDETLSYAGKSNKRPCRWPSLANVSEAIQYVWGA